MVLKIFTFYINDVLLFKYPFPGQRVNKHAHKTVLVVNRDVLDLCKRSLVSTEPFLLELKFGARSRILFVFSFYLQCCTFSYTPVRDIFLNICYSDNKTGNASVQ